MSGYLKGKSLGRASDYIRRKSRDDRVYVASGLPNPEDEFRKAAGERTPSLRRAKAVKVPSPDIGGAALGLADSLSKQREIPKIGWPVIPSDLGFDRWGSSKFGDKTLGRTAVSGRRGDALPRRAVVGRKAKSGNGSHVTRPSDRLERVVKTKHSTIAKIRSLTRQVFKSPAAVRLSKVPSLDHHVSSALHFSMPSFSLATLSIQHMSGQSQLVQYMAKTVFMTSVHEEAIRETILRKIVAKAAQRAAVMKDHCRSAMRVVRTMKRRSPVDSRASHMKKVSSGRRLKQARSTVHGSPFKHRMIFLPQFVRMMAVERLQRVKNVRSRSGKESSAIQRPAGASQQLSVAAFGAVAARMQAMSQSKVPAPLVSPRGNHVAGHRSTGHINPALACPVPVMQQQNGRILSPHVWIDGRLYELIDHIEPEAAEELFSCLVKQLRKGPTLIADDDLRLKANACVQQTHAPIDRTTWEAMLQETIVRALHYVVLFCDRGMRGSHEIYCDAAMLLDIDGELLASWEKYFGVSALAQNLTSEDESLGERFPKHENLVDTIDQQVLKCAVAAFAREQSQSAFLHAFETKVQWLAVRYCAIEDGAEKARKTGALLVDLARKDRAASARMLTMIIRHSVLNKRKMASDALVGRWITEELRQLIIHLNNLNPSVLTDTCFRSQLTSWENAGLNALIAEANQKRVMDRMKKLDSFRPFEDFFEILEDSGRAEEVLDDIVQQMARNFSKIK